jgi:hypothetical protein
MARVAALGIAIMVVAVATSMVWLLVIGLVVLALAPVGFLLPMYRRPPD